jgi:hypothetical protein
MPHTDNLLRELNHRVKNNLQIIVSLISLKKRLLPPDRRDDIRFIEEHVQAMAVAYRLVYANGAMNEVSVGQLLSEVISEMRQISRLKAFQLRVDGNSGLGTMGLDQAVALGLYLAIVLPPYLDRARETNGNVTVSAVRDIDWMTLSVTGTSAAPLEPDFLRDRLSEAYADQLRAEALASSDGSELRIRFQVDDRRLAMGSRPDAGAEAGNPNPEISSAPKTS